VDELAVEIGVLVHGLGRRGGQTSVAPYGHRPAKARRFQPRAVAKAKLARL